MTKTRHSLLNVLALVIVAWPSYARVVRSLVLSVGESEYVWATRLLGAFRLRPRSADVGRRPVGRGRGRSGACRRP